MQFIFLNMLYVKYLLYVSQENRYDKGIGLLCIDEDGECIWKNNLDEVWGKIIVCYILICD